MLLHTSQPDALCEHMQVGYCQGMAFIAGILLMYVPEEPAFRLLARLMSEQAVNMRQLFLPGLAGLKQALRMFEWLLSRIMPGLRLHLEVISASFTVCSCVHVLIPWQAQTGYKIWSMCLSSACA